MPLKLERPLVFFDLETTGTNIQNDRIIEISLIKYYPDSTEETHTYRINPGIPIPPDSTAIHGIKDEDVADCPSFLELAPCILQILENSDLCGYNIIKFDFPLLRMEFDRNGIAFNVAGVKLIDPMRIFMFKEPRHLKAALRYYCDKELTDAHSAEADTRATKDVLFAQLERYDDLPESIDELSKYSNPDGIKFADISGKLKFNAEGEVVFNFGKLQDARVIDNKDYANWMLSRDFPPDTKRILEDLIG